MKPLTAREVEGYLKEYGYEHDPTTGSHRVWINPRNGHAVPIPFHGNRVLPQGTLNAIFNACGIPKPRR